MGEGWASGKKTKRRSLRKGDSCLRGAPPGRLHAAQQSFAQTSACSMGRAGLGGHHVHPGYAPPKAPGQAHTG